MIHDEIFKVRISIFTLGMLLLSAHGVLTILHTGSTRPPRRAGLVGNLRIGGNGGRWISPLHIFHLRAI